MAQLENIKKVQINDNDYSDIEALHFKTGDLDTPAQWKTYIDSIADLGFEIFTDLIGKTLPTADATSYATYKNGIVLCNNGETPETGSYIEWVIVRSGTSSYTYAWEKIGTTSTDLSEYAKKGNYTTGGPSSNTTGNDVTGTAKAYDATGTASVSYKKADANTGNAGGATVNGSNFSFTGTKATLTLSTEYTPAGSVSKPGVNLTGPSTVTYVDGVNTTSGTVSVITAAAKGISLTNDATATTGPTYVQSVSGTFVTGVKSNASVGGTQNFGFSASTSRIMTAPTVSSAGVLSWTEVTAGTQDAHTMTQMTFNTDSVGSVTKYLKATPIAATDKATVIKSDGLSTATFNNYTSAELASAPSFTGTKATLSASIEYTPSGSIGGSQTISAHSHAITYTDTNASGSASVAILTHTHSLSNHTHSITI